MNKVLCCFIAVSLLFVVAESLVCRTCNKSLLGKCLTPANITCPADKQSCFVGKALFNGALDFIGFQTQGCLATAKCNTTENFKSFDFLGTTYNETYYCCHTDFCKAGGPSTAHLSLAAGAAVLFSLWNSMRC